MGKKVNFVKGDGEWSTDSGKKRIDAWGENIKGVWGVQYRGKTRTG